MVRLAKRTFGLDDRDEEIGISLTYRDEKYRPGDSGTVVSIAFRRLAKKGIPQKSWPTIFHRKNLAELEKNKTVEGGWEFTTDFFVDEPWIQAKDFAHAVELNEKFGPEYQMQTSITFSKAINWFGQKKPFIDWKKSTARTGGHSVAGVRNSFSIDKDGDEGFVIIDSAYRKSEAGWRFVTKSMIDTGICRVRFVKTQIDLRSSKKKITIPKTKKTISLSQTYRGEKGKKVESLQAYLYAEGDNTMRNVDGVYGPMTSRAVLRWHLKHQKLMGTSVSRLKRLKGNYFGPVSIRAWKKLSNK